MFGFFLKYFPVATCIYNFLTRQNAEITSLITMGYRYKVHVLGIRGRCHWLHVYLLDGIIELFFLFC